MDFAAIRPEVRETHRPVFRFTCAAISLLALAGLLSAFALQPATARAADESQKTNAEKPYVVMIHADWCGTCKAVAPVWEQIQADLSEETTVVTFDVTDRPAYSASRDAARELGIAEFFNTYRAKTGTIAVLACGSHEPVAVLSGERDFEAYRTAVTKAACKAS